MVRTGRRPGPTSTRASILAAALSQLGCPELDVACRRDCLPGEVRGPLRQPALAGAFGAAAAFGRIHAAQAHRDGIERRRQARQIDRQRIAILDADDGPCIARLVCCRGGNGRHGDSENDNAKNMGD